MTLKTVEQILADMENQRVEEGAKASSQINEMRTEFLSLMITKIIIHFDGSGDSGSIDYIEITTVDGSELEKTVEEKLREDLDTWAYSYLALTNIDWCNNDGGFGDIVIDMETVPFKLITKINTRETISYEAHNSTVMF